MRRVAVIAVALALAMVGVTAAVLTSPARSDGGPYTVRAVFDDASYAVTGEDVRIAGANVGSITAAASPRSTPTRTARSVPSR